MLWTPVEDGKYTFEPNFIKIDGNLLTFATKRLEFNWVEGTAIEINVNSPNLRLCIGTETPFVSPEVMNWMGIVVTAILDRYTEFDPMVTTAAACLTDWAYEHQHKEP